MAPILARIVLALVLVLTAVGAAPGPAGRSAAAAEFWTDPDAVPAPVLSWAGVGRLWLGTGEVCGVSLIGSRIAATAAHCLFDRATGQARPLASMQVQMDWADGAPRRRYRIMAVAVHPGFRPSAGGPGGGQVSDLGAIAADAALLGLEPEDPLLPPLPIYPPRLLPSGTREVAVVGVDTAAGDRQTAAMPCGVLSTRGGILALSCAVRAGLSGAPVVTVARGEARVVGIMSATGADATGPVSLASVSDLTGGRMVAALCAEWPEPKPFSCRMRMVSPPPPSSPAP